jgi:hypothetical protein
MREGLINLFALDFEELIVHVSAISLFALNSKVLCELSLTNVLALEIAQLILFFFFLHGSNVLTLEIEKLIGLFFV